MAELDFIEGDLPDALDFQEGPLPAVKNERPKKKATFDTFGPEQKDAPLPQIPGGYTVSPIAPLPTGITSQRQDMGVPTPEELPRYNPMAPGQSQAPIPEGGLPKPNDDVPKFVSPIEFHLPQTTAMAPGQEGAPSGPASLPTPEEHRKAEGFGYEPDDSIVPLGDLLIKAKGEATGVEEGINESLRNTLNGLVTPRNIAYMLASMGVATTGQVAARLVSAFWAAFMGSHQIKNLPESMKQLGDEMGKPEDQRDKAKIARILADTGIETAFTTLPAVHAASPLKPNIAPPSPVDILESDFPKEFQQPTKTTQSKETNASSQPQATEVHGDLQSSAVEGERQVPTEENKSGIQPPKEEGAQPPIPLSDSVTKFSDELFSDKAPSTERSLQAGMQAKTIADLDALAAMKDKIGESRVRMRDEMEAAMAARERGDLEAEKKHHAEANIQMGLGGRIQLPREAIEAATNSGSHIEGEGSIPEKLGERPLDWRNNPAVQDWMRKNAKRAGLTLPDDFPKEPVEQPTYEQKATEFANRIREQFKTPDVTLSSFGVVPKIIDAAVEIVAKTIEAGGKFADAAAKGIAYIKENHKGDFDEAAFRAKLNTAYNGDKAITGVAQRVREQVAQSGHEELSPRGTGISAEASVNRGNELLKNGADPEKVMSDFESTGRVSGDDIAVARAKLTKLATEARDLEKTNGVESPEYKAAFKARSEWAARVKKMQTEWHKIGQAQQGEVNVDTGTFTGLQGMYQDATGKEFTPKQAKQAQEKSQAVQQSRDAADKSEKDLVSAFDRKINNRTDAEQRALDAANKTVREAAVRKAKAETQERVADTKIKQATEDIQKASEQSALGAANEATKQAAIDAAKADAQKRLDAAKREKETAKVAQAAEQRALDRANKTVREAAILAAKRAKEVNADPLSHVWNTARKYMDLGIFKFDDIVDRVASELGMKREKVIKLLNQTDRIRAMTNDLLTKRQNTRRLDAQAKRWVERQTQPTLQNIAESASRGLFNIRVFGHGPTALGTHAPMIAFQPKFWGDYAKAFVSNFKFMKDPAYYEMKVHDLVREPNYPVAADAGLVVDPFQYEDLNNPKVAVALGKWTGAGARGYTALKFLRMDMFNKYWDELPNHMKTKEMAQGIADSVNHATGVTKAGAPKGTAMALFAPRLLASKVAWLGADPARTVGTFANWKNASPEQKAFAIRTVKERAWVMGVLGSLLALNQGFNKAIGSKQNVNVADPTKSDWLKFKVGNMNVGWGTGLINMARLPARLWNIRESENKRVVPDERTYNTLGEFARTQESPILSMGTDLWFRSDYQDRPLPNSNKRVPKYLRNQGVEPYTWSEWITRQALPIPAEEAMKEVWQHGFGMSKEQQKAYLRAMAKISFTTLGGRLSDDYNVESNTAEPMFKTK